METKQDNLARRMLGWGLAAPLIDAHDVGRDITFARRSATGALDLACVVGAANLGQDLAFALTTARGADPFDTSFGFEGLLALVEETSPLLIRERLRASVAKTVAEDPRVRAVTSVEVGLDGGADRDPKQLEALRRERVLELVVTVDTIAGAPAAFTANVDRL